MSEKCPFLNAEGFQCHLPRALLRLKGELGLPIADLKGIVCESGTPEQRAKDCRAFVDLRQVGKQSEFSRPT